MSTILEALRKLQAERQHSKESGELRSSLVQANYVPRPVAPNRSSRTLWVGSGAAAILVAGGAFVFWPGGEASDPDPLERAVSTEVAQRPRPRQAPSLPSRSDRGRDAGSNGAGTARDPDSVAPDTRERLAQIQGRIAPSGSADAAQNFDHGAPAAASSRPAPRLGGAASPRSRRAPARQEATPERARIQRAPDINFRPPAESTPVRVAGSTQDGVEPYRPPSSEEIARIQARESRDSRTGGGSDRALLSGPALDARREPEPEPPAVIDASAGDESEAPVQAGPIGFPKVRLSSVVWHPEPSRRRAVLEIEGMRSEELREGDLLEGIMIDRIDPGSVELRIGPDVKSVALGS